MGWLAEKKFEAWYVQHELECARDLVVGVPVYRVNGVRIEEGVVRRVSRCDLRDTGPPVEREGGAHIYYVASFGNDWEGQIWQHRWFSTRAKAREEFVRQAKQRIEELQRDIERWSALVEEYRCGL